MSYFVDGCRRATRGIRVCRHSDDGENIAKCIPFRFSFRFTRRTPRQGLYRCVFNVKFAMMLSSWSIPDSIVKGPPGHKLREPSLPLGLLPLIGTAWWGWRSKNFENTKQMKFENKINITGKLRTLYCIIAADTHLSTSELGYFAVFIILKKLDITLFLYWKKRGATLHMIGIRRCYGFLECKTAAGYISLRYELRNIEKFIKNIVLLYFRVGRYTRNH